MQWARVTAWQTACSASCLIHLRYLCICCACSAAAFARCCSRLNACCLSTAADCLAADKTAPSFEPAPKPVERPSNPVVATDPEPYWLARLFETSETQSSALRVTATAACLSCVGARMTTLTFGACGSRAEDSTAESNDTALSYSLSSCRQRLCCGLTSVDMGTAGCCWDACHSAAIHCCYKCRNK